LAPLELVEEELREIEACGTIRSVVFTDDTFNVPLRRFKELLKILGRHSLEWYSFFRPQYADEETAQMMKDSGCRAVFAGLESADDRVLRNMNKVANVEEYRFGITCLKKQGIQVHANFIVGFPGETETSARKIGLFLDDLGIDFYTVCTWAYIPSTPISRRAQEFGLQGMGMKWKHDTMTSEQAQVLARDVVSRQQHSVHNAVRGEAWMEFMLYANGFTVEEVRLVVAFFNEFLRQDVSHTQVRRSPRYPRVKAVLEGRELPMPVL